MSFYLRVVGAMLLAIFALLFANSYSAYVRRSLSELEGFVTLLSHIRGKISVSLASQSVLFSELDCDSLERCGFLPSVRGGALARDAFRSAKFALSKDARGVLSSFFSEFGHGYKADEIARIDSTLSECERILKSEREQAPKDVKLVYTLLVALTLGLVIFLI